MTSHAVVARTRVDNAKKAMRAAIVTIQNASFHAMTAATTVERQAAIAEATEYAIAAIKGMNRAVSPDWQQLLASPDRDA